MGMSFVSKKSCFRNVIHDAAGFLFIFFLLFVQLFTANAQAPTLRLKYFSRIDGLTNSYINQVTQDSIGFIWVATNDGLFRYDGYSFTGYFFNQKDKTSLSGDKISSLYYDSKGRMWLGTNNGLCCYNEETDNFTRINEFQSQAESQTISCIAEDRSGNIYFSIYQGIFRYSEKTKKLKPVVTTHDKEISSFLFDDTGDLWVGCSENAGLFRCHALKESEEINLVTGSSNNVIKDINVNSLAYNGGKLWIASFGNGVKMYDTKTGVTVHYPYNGSNEAKVSRVYIDRHKNVWSSDFTGLKILTPGAKRLSGYYPRTNDPYSIRGSAKGIFQDRQGNYWVYHDPGGVGISMLLKGFTHFDNNNQDYWHTSDINIVALQEDKDGNLWLGNSTNGIDIFNWHTGKTIRHFYNSSNRYSLGQGATMCLFRDSQGTMWIGTYLGGLQYFDAKTGRFITYRHNDSNSNSIAGNDVRSITEDHDGNLWLAVHGKGVDKFDLKQKRFIHYTKSQNRLVNNWTYQVLTDHRGDLWVGTLKGLSRLKKGESVFESWHSEFTDTTTIPNDYVTVLHEDKNNTMWVGTTAGLSRYNTRKGNFTRFTNIFGSDNISGILDDEKDMLWVSTHSGISMFDTSSQKVINFTYFDGLGADEYNPGAMYCNRSNELFFGGIKGVDAFSPDKLKFNTKPPEVYIDGLRVFNRSLSADSTGYRIHKNLRLVKKVTLHHNENIITIYFKALNYINPDLNKYSYKLEGLDKKWHEPGVIREATYTNLSPGKYTFRVIASNNDGIWNTDGARLQIEVVPPWYTTIAAIIFFILIIGGLILWFIVRRTASLERQRLTLEQTVRDKTYELSVKNELLRKHAGHLDEVNKLLVERQNQLEQQSEELINQSDNLARANAELERLNATKNRLFSIIGHDMSTPFTAIIGLTELFEAEYDSLDDQQKHEYIRDINISSHRLYSLLQNLLLWARSQVMGISCNPALVNMSELINETVELRRGDLKSKKVVSVVDCPPEVTAWADPDMTKTILRNLVSNAIKFTPPGGRVSIKVTAAHNEVSVSVSDTGKGISEEKIAQILTADIVEPEWGTNGEKGSGIGLALCRDFIARNMGRLDIQDGNGKGTTFTFTLPAQNPKP